MQIHQLKAYFDGRKKIPFFTVAFCSVVIVISIVYGYIFQTIMLQKVDAFLSSTLDQNEYAVNQMVDYCNTILSQMYTELSINELMTKDLNVYEFQTYYPQLQRYKTIDEDIEAIYVYNSNLKKVYSTSDIFSFGEHEQNEFPDQELWKYMDHPSYYYSLKPVARTIPVETSWDYNGAQEINVFSFFYSNSVKGNYLDHSTIIINYSHNKLSKQLSFFSSDVYGNGSVMIIDQGGQIIFSTNPTQQVHISADTVFDSSGLQFLSDPTIQNGQDCIIDGERQYVLKRNMDFLGWTVISVVPYRYISSEYSVCIFLTLLFAGLIILFGGVSAVTTSRYVQRQKQRELQQKNKELQELEIYYSQQDFLMEVFHGWHRYDLPELECCFEKYSIPLKTQGELYIMIGKIDHYFSYFNTNDKTYRAKISRKIVTTIERFPFNQPVRIVGCNMLNEERDGEFVWVIEAVGSFSLPKFEESARYCFEQIREEIGLQFSLIISNPFYSMDNISFIYKELSEEITIRRVFDGYGIFIHQKGLKTGEFVYPEKEEKLMMANLLNGDFTTVREIFEQIIDHVRYRSEHDVEYTFIQLSHCYYRNVKAILRHNHIQIPDGVWTPYITFEFVEQLDDIRKVFYTALDKLELILQEKRSNKQRELSDKIIEYIRENCNDPNLSRQTIADAFHISYSSAGTVVKGQLPMGIPNYILQLRLENAKKLLLSSNRSIESVAAQCGFSNYIYFHKIFKKNTGITPGDYRKNNRV